MPDSAKSEMNPLDRALAHVMRTRVHATSGEGEIDLAIAWAQGRVSSTQAAVGFGIAKNPMSVYRRIAMAFREGIRSGKIKV